MLKPTYARRGFLPDADPLAAFPSGSPYAALDEIGRDLPSLLYDKGFRDVCARPGYSEWEDPVSAETLAQLRLYYVRVGFLASAYVNQVGEEPVLSAIATIKRGLADNPEVDLTTELWRIANAVNRQVEVLKRISEHMDATLYYRTFRPYIRFFENVTYEGGDHAPMQFRGDTGAQSSIMPTLIAFMKIPHRCSALTDHLDDMRNYMPAEHRALIEEVAAMPDLRALEVKEPYNAILDAMAAFRRVHYRWAEEYISRWTDDPRGTGGTPYIWNGCNRCWSKPRLTAFEPQRRASRKPAGRQRGARA